jgi:hypothetical protein
MEGCGRALRQQTLTRGLQRATHAEGRLFQNDFVHVIGEEGGREHWVIAETGGSEHQHKC